MMCTQESTKIVTVQIRAPNMLCARTCGFEYEDDSSEGNTVSGEPNFERDHHYFFDFDQIIRIFPKA